MNTQNNTPEPPEWVLSSLRVARIADRKTMRNLLLSLCSHYGVVATATECPISSRAFRLHLLGPPDSDAARLEGAVTLDPVMKDCFILHWYLPSGDGLVIAADFAQTRNVYHKRKATDCCFGFADLYHTLSMRLRFIRKGVALNPEP